MGQQTYPLNGRFTLWKNISAEEANDIVLQNRLYHSHYNQHTSVTTPLAATPLSLPVIDESELVEIRASNDPDSALKSKA